MMKNILFSINILALVSLILFVGCKTEQKATTQVYKVDSSSRMIKDGFIYGLPETQLTFKVRLVRNVVVPGPYHQYGEKLLGLSNIPHREKINWQIGNISITESFGMDYDHLYAVEPRGRFQFNWSRFTKQGWIIPFDVNKSVIGSSDFYAGEDYAGKILYKDLSVKKFVGQESKTVYQRVWKDSLFARVPVQETQVVKKNKPEKAGEAANFIFMIREKRFELISGMGDYYPEGKALATAVEEMNRLEEKYLNLFTGIKMADTIEFTINWTPGRKNLTEPDMLMRFSEEEGVLKNSQNKGTPLWLEIDTLESMDKVSRIIQNKMSSPDSLGFHYRIPVKSILRLKYGDKLMAKKYLEVSQFGPVFQIPYKFLNDSRIIEFFPANE